MGIQWILDIPGYLSSVVSTKDCNTDTTQSLQCDNKACIEREEFNLLMNYYGFIQVFKNSPFCLTLKVLCLETESTAVLSHSGLQPTARENSCWPGPFFRSLEI